MERSRPTLARPTERGLAGVLDQDGIAWDCEPHTFVLARSADGGVRRAFTPDFSLPEVGLYVECSVAYRSLTTRRRRKARAARRRYGIPVEIAYLSDLEYLARRWSLRELERAPTDS